MDKPTKPNRKLPDNYNIFGRSCEICQKKTSEIHNCTEGSFCPDCDARYVHKSNYKPGEYNPSTKTYTRFGY